MHYTDNKILKQKSLVMTVISTGIKQSISQTTTYGFQIMYGGNKKAWRWCNYSIYTNKTQNLLGKLTCNFYLHTEIYAFHNTDDSMYFDLQ